MLRTDSLLKPSLGELCDWAGQKLVTDEEIVAGAHKLLSQTGSKAVVVSLGRRGAIMVTATCHAALAAIQVQKRVPRPQAIAGSAASSPGCSGDVATRCARPRHDRGRRHRDACPGTEASRREDVEQ